jgi:tungstate transport system ATP-binding protein
MLVLEPEVLLLDEPFSYLDQSSAQSLELFLRRYAQAVGQTLVFSTHDRLQGFALADEVLALAQGKRVHSPLINLFTGVVREHVFYSGAMRINLPEGVVSGHHASRGSIKYSFLSHSHQLKPLSYLALSSLGPMIKQAYLRNKIVNY